LTKQSITLDPVKAITYYNFGQVLYYTNHFEEAIVSFKKVLELNPQFSDIHNYLGNIYLLQGKPEMALAEMQQVTEKAPKDYGMALAYHALGRRKEADEALTNYIVNYQNDWEYLIAKIFAFRREKDKAFEWLEKAYIARDSRLTFLKGDPLLKNLESDPRHTAFLKKMNLPID
jgi:tetratricopeptide (TPR) repeat protein